MSNDFWAGYLSGAIGIVIGNPLDVLKVRLQASFRGRAEGNATGASSTASRSSSLRGNFESAGALVRGAAAPILTYGALNAILFVAYNRSLTTLSPSVTDPTNPVDVPLHHIWTAGAAGGLASWVVSSPTELVKCRAQLASRAEVSSWSVAREIWGRAGIRGLYWGGGVTAVRDAVGYGFYFWSYELCKRLVTTENESSQQEAMKILLCGGIAGIVTWASVFPLDVVKTKLQAQNFPGLLPVTSAAGSERQALLGHTGSTTRRRPLNAMEITREAFRAEGISVFYRGLGICSLRAFIVNAVQWATYEWIMKALSKHGDIMA